MASDFAPDERQRRLIKQAQENAERNRVGRHAPAELVRRMTFEGSLVVNHDSRASQHHDREEQEPKEARMTDPDTSSGRDAAFRVVLAAAVDEQLSSEGLQEHLAMPNCIGATAFRAPRHVLLLEFDFHAPDLQVAITAAVEEVLHAFPLADFVDLNGQNALIDALVESTQGRPPNHGELQMMYYSTVPSNDSVALAAGAVDALMSQPHGEAKLIEADVFDVLPSFGLAHLTTTDGRMFGVTSRTPGIASLDDVKEGQRYLCWVIGRFDLVLRAELIS